MHRRDIAIRAIIQRDPVAIHRPFEQPPVEKESKGTFADTAISFPASAPQDVGHSKQAREMLKKYYIGEFAGGPSAKPSKAAKGVARMCAAGSPPNSPLSQSLRAPRRPALC